MRKTKKLLSLVLSAAMLATALPVTALAANGGGSIEGSGTVVGDLVYSLIVPTDLNFVVNPMGFEYTGLDGVKAKDQIISPGYGFVNASTVPVELDVNIKYTSAAGVVIATGASAILNKTGEAPTIYMEVQPTKNEPLQYVTGDATSVVFATDGSVSFVTDAGIAITEDGLDVRFKMNAANYILNAANETEYVDNNVSGSSIGFRFGGKVSSTADWTDKAVAVNAVYSFAAISDADYDDPDNTDTTKGFNWLETSLVEAAPSLSFTNGNTLTINNVKDDYKDANGAYMAKGLYFVADTVGPINVNGMTLTVDQFGEGKTNGGYPTLPMAMSLVKWDAVAGTIELNAKGLDAVKGYNCAIFVILGDSNGNEIVVPSSSIKF